MTAVRKIVVTDPDGSPAFTLEVSGLPDRPVIMHECDHCQAMRIVSVSDAGDVAAWLIGEAVDDAQGNGALDPELYEYGVCELPGCKMHGERIVKGQHRHIMRENKLRPDVP